MIDDVIGLAINARVISIERDLLGLEPDEIKLGNYKKVHRRLQRRNDKAY